MNDITKTTTDLAEYLNMIFNEEILLDQQKTIWQQLKANAPVKKSVRVPSEIVAKPSDRAATFFALGLPAAGIGLVVGIIMATATGSFAMIPIMIIIVEIFCAAICSRLDEESDAKEAQKVAQNREDIQQAIKENEKLEEEYKKKLSLWDNILKNIEQRINETQKVLDLIYSDNVIYVKYRNMVAISALKEYIESGRAGNLPEAYDKFEVEYRLDGMQRTLQKIDRKLDLALDKLDNMTYELSNAIKDNSEKSRKFNVEMIRYMDRVVDNQQEQLENLTLIKNDQRCIQENTKALGYIKNTQGRNIDMTPFVKLYNEKMYQ